MTSRCGACGQFTSQDHVCRYPDSAETGQDFKLITEDPGRQHVLDRITQQAQVSPEKLAELRQNILTLAEPQVKPRFRRWRKRR